MDKPDELKPCAVPLVEQLENVPAVGRIMYEVGPTEHRNIPYGRLCQEAAARIRALESDAEVDAQLIRDKDAEIERLKAERDNWKAMAFKADKTLRSN